MNRLAALVMKESRQILKDPSSVILAFVIPVLMIMLFGYCINFDSSYTSVALVLQDEAPAAHSLVERLAGSPNFRCTRAAGQPEAMQALHRGDVNAVLVVPEDFSRGVEGGAGARLLLVSDGTVPNTANFTNLYVQSVYAAWAAERGHTGGITVQPSYRFNPAAISHNYVLPASIAVVLSFIATFLTAMVVAREWERGTMEAILASTATRTEFILSKLIPYFVLGMGAMGICMLSTTLIFHVPLQAPLWMVFAEAGLMLFSVLAFGLLISTLVRNQYSASLISLQASILPTILLSGFIFEISSMPQCIQAVSYLIPARYLARCLTSLFQAGAVPSVMWFNTLALAVSAVFWLGLVFLATPKRLDQ